MTDNFGKNEHVVLVDESNNPLGLAQKQTVHTNDTPLHRGFSLFIFNTKGQILLQKRSSNKITWPDVWSNSVCGHPANGETPQAAAVRRSEYELGIKLDTKQIHLILEDYRYRYSHQQVVENEICPVMVVFGNYTPKLNDVEVGECKWVEWKAFLEKLSKPNKFSEWCQEEAKLLSVNEKFKKLYTEYVE